ncbi:hypothetical protein HPP92_011935 [Vanilla planifolia]|uniref:Carboxymethylenebutenolidase homolog n=1 Tax=Vanilla planifolia TaxID=51239 RepID=A0A835R808_VANPL|nr:hypothetical protein HPP92_011935 [Vanilla planifolia]
MLLHMAVAAAATLHCSPAQRLIANRLPKSLLLPFHTITSFENSGLVQRQCYSRRSTRLRLHQKDATYTSQTQDKLEIGVDDETCELVNGSEILIEENGNSIRAYLLKAVKNNNGTGLLLLSDAFGFEDSSTRDFAYRIACNGYNVLVPDLFRGNPWKNGMSVTGFDHWLAGQPPERITKDIETSAQWLVEEFVAAGISKKLGIVELGFGGGHLFESLERDKNSYFGAGVCFYGTNISTSLTKDTRVPILFIFGDEDPLCPTGMILSEMEKRIEGSRVMIYVGRGHGFAHRPQSQEEDRDAEDVFNVMRNWLHDHLLVDEGAIVGSQVS